MQPSLFLGGYYLGVSSFFVYGMELYMTTVNSTQEPASSNSGLRNQILRFSLINSIEVSLDRLSFTAKISSAAEAAFLAGIGNNSYITFTKNLSSMAEGQAYDKALYFKYDKFSPFPSGNNVRIEMNPNKMTVLAIKDYERIFLPYFISTSVTRIDIAIDVPADLTYHYFYLSGIRKQSLISGGDGIPQTRYLGTRNSDRYVRLYNKKLERLENVNETINHEHLWRLELQLSGDWINKWDTCLDGLVCRLPLHMALDGTDSPIVAGLMAYPETWGKLSPNTRRRYRKLLREMPAIEDEMPVIAESFLLSQSAILELINAYTGIKDNEQLQA